MQTRHAKNEYFYACPWEATSLTSGLHTLRIDVTANSSLLWSHQHLFSIDGTAAPLRTLSMVLLQTNLERLLLIGFLTLYAALLALTSASLYLNVSMHRTVQRMALPPHGAWKTLVGLGCAVCDALYTRKQYLTLFWCYLLLLPIVPIFVGEINTGRIGALWLYGAYSSGTFIPSPSGMMTGLFQLLLGVTPYLTSLAIIGHTRRILARAAAGSIMTVCILLQVRSVYVTFYSYGLIATIINPIETGLLIIMAWSTQALTY